MEAMTMGGRQSSTFLNVVTIYSEEPQLDAETLLKLLPKRYRLEQYDLTTSVGIVDDEEGGTMVVVAKCSTQADSPAFLPERNISGTLVLKEQEIRDSLTQCGEGKASVVFQKSIPSLSGESLCTLIRLAGGATVFLVSCDILPSPEGRQAITRLITSPDNMFDELGGNTEVLTDVSLSDPSDHEERALPVVENGKSIMKEEESVPPKKFPVPPKFPTLAVSLLQKGGHIEPNFQVNSREGVPVETDLFVGKMILVLRPSNPSDDPFYNEKIFSKKKRKFILQVQGKFKYVPKGMVYAGGEISDQMKLGLVGKGLCSVLLNLIRSFYPDMHYSFGDDKNIETPHIVFPAWQFFESLIMTKPGETPPLISEPFEEPKASKEARKSLKIKPNWNTEDTFSMSYHSMYLDLPNWKVVNVPVTKDLDLRTFWGNSFLSIVFYERAGLRDDRHVQKQNTYYFRMQMKFLGHHAAADDDEASSENEDLLPWNKSRPLARTSSTLEQLKIERQSSEGFLEELSDDEGTRFFDAEDMEVGLNVEDDGWFYFDASQSVKEANNAEPPSKVDIVCPAWVEICSSKGKYTTAYAFNIKYGTEALFRTTSQFADYFDTDKAKVAVGAVCSPRMSSAERARRLMGHAFAQAITGSSRNRELGANIYRFKMLTTEWDTSFLKKPGTPKETGKTSRPVLISGYAARAISEHHWVEEWAQATDMHVSFYQPSKNRPNFRMSLKSIINVRGLTSSETPPFPCHSFLAIETLGRTVYMMFAGEAERNHWVDKLLDLKSAAAMKRAENNNRTPSTKSSEGKKSTDRLLLVDDPTEEFLHKSTLWSCKQRRILNCRKFAFGGVRRSVNPASTVENAMTHALDPNGDSEKDNLIAFLDSAAALKEVDVNELKEKEKLAFFLNLYHVMIMHAFLVLGTPDSAFKWMSYFNMIAYQCSDDIFSLTELEHNIIRASMHYPSQFISKFVLPKSKFRFALTMADYRINFALNSGSYSNPDSVPIYRVTSLDQQLNWASSEYLRVARVTPRENGNVSVTLPRVCLWFADDFGDGSVADVIRTIAPHLEEKYRKHLAKYIHGSQRNPKKLNDVSAKVPFIGDIWVKYLPYAFECRHLKLRREEAMQRQSL